MAPLFASKTREDEPIFIPNLRLLRLACLDHVSSKLRMLQDRMHGSSPFDRDQKLDEATDLLTRFGTLIAVLEDISRHCAEH